MIGVHGKKMVKEIIVVYNKLIIYNENLIWLFVKT
jgi:hypothetical protein